MTLSSELEPRQAPGRPTRLTRETHDAIVTAIESGAYVKIAAQAAGVGQSTLAGWLARGREAVSLRDRMDPDRRYCPSCLTDREDDAASADAEQERLDAEYAAAAEQWTARHDQQLQHDAPAEPPPVHTGVVLDRCPSCGSHEPPTTWTLPDTEAPYLELLESVTRAQATAEVAAVAAWRSAWRDDWRAARDYLARTSPERWAGVTRVQMTTEESERRVDDAVNEALVALGVDHLGDEDADLDDTADDR